MRRHLSNGLVISDFAAAPADFDPAAASEHERRKYGFLGIPGAPELQSKVWESRRTHRFVPARLRARKMRRTVVPGWGLDHPDSHTGTWSGVVCGAPAGDPLTWVKATWTIPNAALPFNAVDGTTYTVSSWVGLDGSQGTADVLQAGFDSSVTFSGASVQHTLSVWTEWFPAGSAVAPFPASVGDTVTVLVQWADDAASGTITNETTGGQQTFTIYGQPGTVFSGKCAEWIVEKLDTGPLARFNAIVFSSCQAGTAGGASVQPLNGSTMQMTDGAGNSLAVATAPSADQVQVTFG